MKQCNFIMNKLNTSNFQKKSSLDTKECQAHNRV